MTRKRYFKLIRSFLSSPGIKSDFMLAGDIAPKEYSVQVHKALRSKEIPDRSYDECYSDYLEYLDRVHELAEKERKLHKADV